MMFTLVHLPCSRRRGSVLLTTLFVVAAIGMLLSAILPLTVTGYGVARADRDRAAALAAAEAGLNWELARINMRRWDRDDSGSLLVDGSNLPTSDYWPDPTIAPPASTSAQVLLTDGTGGWTQRFLVGSSTNPYGVSASGSFTICAEGQVRAADGHVVKRRVKVGGAGLFSVFDSGAIFAFSTASGSSSACSLGGSTSITGGCGSNGRISGNGGPAITVGPLGLWGPNASITGVTTTGVTQFSRSGVFDTDTADQAANVLRTGFSTGSGVAGWRPAGYDASGNATGPADKFGRIVNSQAEIVTSSGTVSRAVKANEFLDNGNQPVLDHHLTSGSNRLRLKPGVYYFAQINLNNSDTVEIANGYYRADGVTPLTGAGSAADYNSDGNRIMIFVDDISGYANSSVGSGLYTTLQGSDRRPGNFRIYAKNSGDFTVSGSKSSSFEFNVNLLHYNKDNSGNSYGSVSLGSGCHLYGGLFGWTIDTSGGATVEQSGAGIFAGNDPVTVIPSGGSGGAGAGGGIGGGFGGWQWQELAIN
jgi:type II secretory pathway pseudopilin PulG